MTTKTPNEGHTPLTVGRITQLTTDVPANWSARQKREYALVKDFAQENRALIAQRDELLEALEKLLCSAATHHYSNLEGVIEARAAILNAKSK